MPQTFSPSSLPCWRTMRCARRHSTAIAGGTPAHEAWSAALGGEILGYESSDDEYFRARAEDLRDIRDRVLRHLFGVGPEAAGGAAVLFRRGHAADPLSRHRLVAGRCHRAEPRQQHQPRGHAGPGTRHSHGGGTWRRRSGGRFPGHRRWRQRHVLADPDAAMAERLRPAPRRSCRATGSATVPSG